jgi:ParB family chromosome partitioning protein
MSNNKRSALGRGLSALLENENTDVTSRSNTQGSTVVGAVANIDIDKIEANPFQPRTHFEEDALNELAHSIKEQGIIQPVTVRKLGYDKYQLISGERRFKASKIAGLLTIPAYIRIANDQAMLEMAIVENIQRENLNSIEIAISYQRLLEECSLTQEELSNKVGKNRSTVSNYLRMLKLPPEIQIGIRDGKITMGHARAIINIEDPEAQLAIYHDIINGELSVRKVEELARVNNKSKKSTNSSPKANPIEFVELQNTLSERLQTKVAVMHGNKGAGKIVIPYLSSEDLERVLKIILP